MSVSCHLGWCGLQSVWVVWRPSEDDWQSARELVSYSAELPCAF